MLAKHTKRVRGSERGVALFIALFTLLLITAIAASMIMLTNTDTTISANFRDEQTAFFAAKAGLEEVRDRLRTNAVNGATNISLSSQLPGFSTPSSAPPVPGQANGVLYVTNPLNAEADTPWVTNGNAYPDDEICPEVAYMGINVACTGNPPRPQPGSGGWYVTATSNSLYAANPVQPWKWVRATVKTNQTSSGTANAISVDGNLTDYTQLVCWNGTSEFVISSAYASCSVAGAAQVPAQNWVPVYVLTSLAVTPSGSRRMVQMDVATDTIPAIPGALVMDGDLPNFGPGSSNAFSATGNDTSSSSNALRPQNGTTCPAPGNQPAVGAYDTTSATTINATFGSGPSSRSGNYTGSPAGVSNVNTSLNSGGLNTIQGLDALVTMVTSGAVSPNIYSSATSLVNPGTATNPVVNVVTGNATLTSFTGAGILLVEGTLTFSGKPNFDGVILVIGQGNLQFTGGGNGVIDGAVLVANLYDPLGNLITSGAPGAPVIGFSGGGSMTIQYDSCWVAAMNNATPYKSLGVREMAY
jgi:hypothetical protein